MRHFFGIGHLRILLQLFIPDLFEECYLLLSHCKKFLCCFTLCLLKCYYVEKLVPIPVLLVQLEKCGAPSDHVVSSSAFLNIQSDTIVLLLVLQLVVMMCLQCRLCLLISRYVGFCFCPSFQSLLWCDGVW